MAEVREEGPYDDLVKVMVGSNRTNIVVGLKSERGPGLVLRTFSS